MKSLIYWTCVTFVYIFAIVHATDYATILSHIKTDTDEATQARAAYNVIARTVPDRVDSFRVIVDFELPRNTFSIIKNETLALVHITGSSGVAACKGFYYYVKYYCNGHISWDGNQLNLPGLLPDANVQQTASSWFIYYQNVCTWSYSFAWWKWTDWQRHIDWMAMQGITLSLAPVQEFIWSKVYAELGLTSAEINEHLSGPGFMSWQRMGNIRGWGGPTSRYYRRSASKLQIKIVKTLRDLGMAVALPAFAGHVPVAFKRIFPNATFSRVDRWNRFSDEFCCPLFIDPVDPLFKTVGELFLSKVIERYGVTNHLYFSDPFNEVQPRLAEPVYLSSAAKGIYETIQVVDPKGVWLLQGWMFVKNPVWNEDLIESFLTAVAPGRILVLDLQSEQSPQYERTKSFYGQPFIWCMLHNFGGTLGMHGSVDILNDKIPKASQMPNSTMYGVGITPEGIYQNYVMYEFALERAWNYTKVDTEKWFDHYATARYGVEDEYCKQAWRELLKSVYSYNGSATIRGKYIICKRPSLDLTPLVWYDIESIYSAWGHLLNASKIASTSALFQHDLVDVVRQFFQVKIELLYVQLIDAYQKNLPTRFQFASQRMVLNMHDLNEMLSCSPDFLLGKWLEAAKNMSNNEDERRLYERNARNQITVWGPEGQIVDYAMKQWAGMIVDYCLPRWELFFATAIDALNNNTKINMATFRRKVLATVELPFVLSNYTYDTQPYCPFSNPLQLARVLFEKYGDPPYFEDSV